MKESIGHLSELKMPERVMSYYEAYNILLDALREIDTHIRSDKEPIPYIIETLKKTLPEYKE
jgi:hypothetical protein